MSSSLLLTHTIFRCFNLSLWFILSTEQQSKLENSSYLKVPCTCHIKSCVMVNIAWCQMCSWVHQELYNILASWQNSLHKACLSTTIHTVWCCTLLHQFLKNLNWALQYHWKKYKSQCFITVMFLRLRWNLALEVYTEICVANFILVYMNSI